MAWSMGLLGYPYGFKNSYWMATLGGTSADYGEGIAVRGKDVYVVGTTFSIVAARSDALLSKFNSSGIVQWQRILFGSSADKGSEVAIDSTGNVYMLGQTRSQGSGADDYLLAKYDPNGTIQWQRILGGTLNDDAYGLAIDSNDNIYIAGQTYSAGVANTDFVLAKYNSSGTIQWQRTLGGTRYDERGTIAIDSNDNVYLFGYTSDLAVTGSLDFVLAKYNPSGTLQWQRFLGGTGQEYTESKTIVIDSSDNIYVTGRTDSSGAGGTDCFLAKYNTSGTVQWQRTFGSTANEQSYAIAVDPSGDVYIGGFTYNILGSSRQDFLFAKYNPSGTLQWQRFISTIREDELNGLEVDSEGGLYVIGQMAYIGTGNYDFFITRLPTDGSLTGAYEIPGNAGRIITYGVSSMTSANSFFTEQVSSMTSQAGTLIAGTSTLTSADTPLISSLFLKIG